MNLSHELMRIAEIVDENKEVIDNHPEYLYHATYRPLLKKIQAEGLGGKSSRRKWEDSKKGVTYWSADPDVAESYAESSEMVNEDWLDEIVVLRCKYSDFDSSKLIVDENVILDDDDTDKTYEYHGGVIPWSKLQIVE